MAETQQHAGEGQDKRTAQTRANGDEPLPDDVDALKAALAEERKKHSTLLNEVKRVKAARDELTTKMKTWNQLEEEGYEPEQIKALLSKQQDDDLQKARSQGEIDKLLENQRKKHDKENEGLRSELDQERRINNEIMVDNLLLQELSKVVEPRLLKGAFHLHRSRCKTVEDPEAQYGRRTVVEVDNEYMAVPDWIKHWAENDEEAQAYLKASMASGGGAGGTAGGKFRVQLYRKDMTPAEKSKYIREHTKAEYDKLPWAPTPSS